MRLNVGIVDYVFSAHFIDNCSFKIMQNEFGRKF